MGVLDGLSVLVTGGTGSFGQKFVEMALRDHRPKRLVVLSRGELRQADMKARWPEGQDSPIRYFIRDVRGPQRDLDMAFEGIDVVVHAAALKRIEVCEREPYEAIATNIHGTENVIAACRAGGVKKLLFISSDKATEPLNAYGSTKMAAEKAVIAANNYRRGGYPICSCVRYGNVLGSNGSVVPIWREQMKRGEPITITAPDMSRFAITRQSAVEFVLGCLPLMQGGEVFIPKLPSISTGDLANAVAQGWPRRLVGMRQGEKKHELMIGAQEAALARDLGDRYVILPSDPQWPFVQYAGAQGVPEEWAYSSGTNTEWLSREQVLTMLGAD